jgi:SAM-dependent methyltransferase
LPLTLLRRLDRLFPPNRAAYLTPQAQTDRELAKADSTMGSFLAELGRTDVDVLDYGCGWGGETRWLAERVRSAVGFDVDPDAIAQARQAAGDRCRFVQSGNGLIPLPDQSVDAVFSCDTFEHVMDLELAFRELFRVLRPNGRLLTQFGPLFYSPHGYHLYWACQVPWAHLLFGLPAILQLREERSGNRNREATWQETGLNGFRFDDYRRAALAAGFRFVRFKALPVRGLTVLTRLPLLRHLFIFGIDAHLERP